MAAIRLEFAQFGHFDYFKIYRNLASTNIEDLGPPIGTSSTMYYEDSTVEPSSIYFYRVGVVRDLFEEFSEEFKIQAGDLNWSDVISLLYFKDDFVDETARIWTSTGVSFSEETPFLGIKSCSFSASLQSELRSTASTSLGSGDFTVEMFSKGKSSLFSKRIPTGTSNAGMTFFVSSSDRIAAWNGSSEVSSSATIDVSAFTHKAFVKHGNRLKMFVNGQMLYDEVYSLSDNSYPMQIGAATYSGVSVDFFNGLIAMPRITKTARYTENFTPSDFVFPNS